MPSFLNIFSFFVAASASTSKKLKREDKRMKGPDFNLNALPDEVFVPLLKIATENAKYAMSTSTNDPKAHRHDFSVRKDGLHIMFVNKRLYRLTRDAIAQIEHFQPGWFRKQVALQATLDCRSHHFCDRQYMTLFYTQNGHNVSESKVIVSYDRFRMNAKVHVTRRMPFGERWIVVSDRCMADPLCRKRPAVHVLDLFNPEVHLVAPDIQIPRELLSGSAVSAEPGRLDFCERSFQNDLMEALRTLGV
jgi:hypothetical protein